MVDSVVRGYHNNYYVQICIIISCVPPSFSSHSQIVAFMTCRLKQLVAAASDRGYMVYPAALARCLALLMLCMNSKRIGGHEL